MKHAKGQEKNPYYYKFTLRNVSAHVSVQIATDDGTEVNNFL